MDTECEAKHSWVIMLEEAHSLPKVGHNVHVISNHPCSLGTQGRGLQASSSDRHNRCVIKCDKMVCIRSVEWCCIMLPLVHQIKLVANILRCEVLWIRDSRVSREGSRMLFFSRTEC